MPRRQARRHLPAAGTRRRKLTLHSMRSIPALSSVCPCRPDGVLTSGMKGPGRRPASLAVPPTDSAPAGPRRRRRHRVTGDRRHPARASLRSPALRRAATVRARLVSSCPSRHRRSAPRRARAHHHFSSKPSFWKLARRAALPLVSESELRLASQRACRCRRRRPFSSITVSRGGALAGPADISSFAVLQEGICIARARSRSTCLRPSRAPAPASDR